jgi:hypothetical protein
VPGQLRVLTCGLNGFSIQKASSYCATSRCNIASALRIISFAAAPPLAVFTGDANLLDKNF